MAKSLLIFAKPDLSMVKHAHTNVAQAIVSRDPTQTSVKMGTGHKEDFIAKVRFGSS